MKRETMMLGPKGWRRRAILGTGAAAVYLAQATAGIAGESPARTYADDPAFGPAVRSFLLENPDVILEVFSILEAREAERAAGADRALIEELGNEIFRAGDGWFGDPEPREVLVEFADYRCGYCKANHQALVDWTEAVPGRAVLIKEFPILGEESRMMAETALAVRTLYGNEAYAKLHELLITLQGNPTPGILRTFIDAAGWEFELIEVTRRSDEVQNRLTANHALAKRLGITGTPSFVAADQIVRGFLNSDQLGEIGAKLVAGR